MARGRVISIDDKIEQAKARVSRTKGRYDEAVEELHQLQQKKQELQSKELVDAFLKSERSFEEIMSFLKGKPACETAEGELEG